MTAFDTTTDSDMDAALFSSASHHRTKWITIRDHDEFGLEVPAEPTPSRPADAAMTAALDAMAEAARRSPMFFGDRRALWEIEAERNASIPTKEGFRHVRGET